MSHPAFDLSTIDLHYGFVKALDAVDFHVEQGEVVAVAYLDKIKERLAIPLTAELPIDLSSIDVFVGGLLGVMLVFVFSSLTIRAVGSAGSKIIEEVRRQFRENPGIMQGTVRPDYARAVDITARAALREMVFPGALAVGMPVVVGLVFRYFRDASVTVGGHEYANSSGWLAVSGMLIIGTIGGIMMATFFNNSGGAWDNAKKFIETGEFGGKGSEAHKAAVVGDTVGDPFKDTAGPALNPLIKVMNLVSLLVLPAIISNQDKDRKSTRLNSSHSQQSRMPSSA